MIASDCSVRLFGGRHSRGATVLIMSWCSACRCRSRPMSPPAPPDRQSCRPTALVSLCWHPCTCSKMCTSGDIACGETSWVTTALMFSPAACNWLTNVSAAPAGNMMDAMLSLSVHLWLMRTHSPCGILRCMARLDRTTDHRIRLRHCPFIVTRTGRKRAAKLANPRFTSGVRLRCACGR